VSAATLMAYLLAGSSRLLADVHAVARPEPALVRLDAALGREFADRLVGALSGERFDRGIWRS
jgi:hypothetical protein